MDSRDIENFKERLKTEVVKFEFIKKDGTRRLAFGTRIPRIITQHVKGVGSSSPKVITFWDTQKSEWRSVRPESITAIFK